MSIYDAIANDVPAISRGTVWCRACRRMEYVNGAWCLQNGWPKCCGSTMTVDPPETWGEK